MQLVILILQMLTTNFHVAPGLGDFFSLLEVTLMGHYMGLDGDRPSENEHVAAIKSEASDFKKGFRYRVPDEEIPMNVTFTIENHPYNTRDLVSVIAGAIERWYDSEIGGRNYKANVTIIDNTLQKHRVTMVIEHEAEWQV